MGNSATEHNDTSLGGGGALSYAGNSQQRANQVNINKIIETIPYENDRKI